MSTMLTIQEAYCLNVVQQVRGGQTIVSHLCVFLSG
jgi:hypothetical protein